MAARYTARPIFPEPLALTRVLFKNLAGNLCGNSRLKAFGERPSDQSPAMAGNGHGLWIHFSLIDSRNLQVKSLILAQIERWRRA
jgi:hypothetical protein